MILTGPEIERRLESGDITCSPAPTYIGPNSMDVCLGPDVLIYPRGVLTTRPNEFERQTTMAPTSYTIDPENGIFLTPGELYLARTLERVCSRTCVPYLGGRSSIGRLGIRIHATAGFGDIGFDGVWTLEIDVIRPVRMYAGDRIGQLWFFTAEGDQRPYAGRYQHSTTTVASRMHDPKEPTP